MYHPSLVAFDPISRSYSYGNGFFLPAVVLFVLLGVEGSGEFGLGLFLEGLREGEVS